MFSQPFVGRSVGISRISRVKEVSKSNRPRIDRIPTSQRTRKRCQYRRTCPLKLLKLEKKLAFFQAHGHDRLLFFFGESYNRRSFEWRATATSKVNLPVIDMGLKERHRLHGDAKKHGSAWQGLYLKISRNRRAGCHHERK